MLQSKLFYTTAKKISEEEKSMNAQLLIRGGFIDKLMAGVFSYLPLGLRVLDKIKNIIREEMNAIGGQEIYMPALTPKENWLKTGRWDDLDVLFKLKDSSDKDYALGATHEEVVTPLAKKFINSYKDLPLYLYQIQDKFRNEPRAKSGLLRGREFSMKDLYSFHADEADLNDFYEKSKIAYIKIFKRCELDILLAEASGGTFSKYSHEFQVLAPSGEDVIFYCPACRYAQNQEISEYKEEDACPKCGEKIKEGKAIEVGNIFKLKTKYSEAFDLSFLDKDGTKKLAMMGCYGIGPSRIMGAVAEILNDEQGLIWPKGIAPFDVHLVAIWGKGETTNKKIEDEAEKICAALQKQGIGVLYDDRKDVSTGVKFSESDLIGIPQRLILSEKTLGKESVEVKKRKDDDIELVKITKLLS